MQSIKEVDQQEFQSATSSFVDRAQPIVIRGLVDHWPAVKTAQRSSSEFLTQLSADASPDPVTAFILEEEHRGRVFYNAGYTDFNFSRVRTSLAGAIEELTRFNQVEPSKTLYIGSVNLEHWLPSFANQNPQPVELVTPTASLWLGNKSVIAAHFDVPHNLACVVSGRRRFSVFPPESLPDLYIGPIDLTPAGQPISLVDLKAPDFDAHPRFKHALSNGLSTELNAGDAIFIPSLWWHHVEGLETVNALINYWWRPGQGYGGPPLAALQHAMLAFKDLSPEERRAWRTLLDYYVFDTDDTRFDYLPVSARGILNPLTPELSAQLRTIIRQMLK